MCSSDLAPPPPSPPQPAAVATAVATAVTTATAVATAVAAARQAGLLAVGHEVVGAQAHGVDADEALRVG